MNTVSDHDDVIKWKHFPRYWPFVRGIHRSAVDSPHIGRWRGTLIFFLICTRTNGWLNNRDAGDLRHNHTRYDTIAMFPAVQVDVMIRIHSPCYWSFTIGISWGIPLAKGQKRGALLFSLMYAWTNFWTHSGVVGVLRGHVMSLECIGRISAEVIMGLYM